MTGIGQTALVIALSAGGAGLFRLRGSETWHEWTGRGATSIRAVLAAYLALAAWLADNGTAAAWSGATAPFPLWLFVLALAIWLGCIAGWWHSLGVASASEVARHSARGLLFVIFGAAVLGMSGLGTPWPLMVAGASCGPIYLAVRLLRPSYAIPGAEFVFGGVFSLALLGGVAWA